MTLTKTSFLDAALDYAKRGWYVFPLQALDKLPLSGSKGVHEATTDKKQIETWWTRHKNSNIGIHCTGFWALDVDPRHNGVSALEGLIREYGPLPVTLTQTSGSGGKHYLFNVPLGTIISNRAGFYPGLDTRAYGGYILGAPSETEAGVYSWDNEGTPIADAPEWLLNMVKPAKGSFKLPERSDTGSRDADDASLAGALHNLGMSEDEIFDALQKRNNNPNKRDVPLPTNEIWKTVRSICSREIRTPAALRQAIHSNAVAQRQAGVVAVAPDEMWEDRLIRSKTLIPKNILANSEAALTHSPLFCNSLAFNSMSAEVMLTRNIVEPLNGTTVGNLTAGKVVDEHIVREMTALSQRLITAVTFNEMTLGAGVQMVARLNYFHPVQDYLNALVWDGTLRIDQWLIDHIGVEDDADGYARAVGRRWLISAVARALNPGCKADCALIIEGTQGCRKSSALRTLAGADWFKDSTIDFKSKDRFSAVRGVWIYEMAEFDQYRNHDAATIKNFLSSQDDSYRPAYARTDAKYPRGVVFVGTTNKDKYLTDDTGDRRFWPVKSTRTMRKPINTERLGAERDQLWAEAVRAYYNGEPAFIDMPKVIAAHERIARERHDVEDTWADDYIRPYLAAQGHKPIKTGDLMNNALNLKVTDHTKANQNRVKGIMQSLGYVYKANRTSGDLVKSWVKSNTQQDLSY